ncbi:hypothetical protein N7462_009346 [Penicillium macrosclerotiorum]|uniref:uncharacterized protein n=1 Tax=Penicillium macrosclerotiorum TaxID=303699 RepID=UPI002548EE76|nr:uncharacterized protein N7462_009346 [Penicillium macrosclerotiorum]KAJ5673907.1 hypothetical protein N7462_009346 [Penicillium macrosclerotiorum]
MSIVPSCVLDLAANRVQGAREQLSDDSDGSPLQFMIPTRFAQVVDGIYRSSFPNVLHIDIHQALGVKTILSLVSTEYSWANVHWMLNRDTKVLSVPVIANKDPHIKTTERVVNMILSILMHEKNHPIVVHCNEGKHRTGCIIGCFRKLQGWDHASIIEEYREFAGDKARALDEDFIQAYEPRRGMKKQARRKQVATWIQAPERLTSNTPDERPLLPQHDNDTLFALSP